jgi:methylase of polypeptide subunit release factors
MNDHTRLDFNDADDIQRIRDVFEAASYSQSGIEQLLGCDTPIAPLSIEIPPQALSANGDSPLETLIRLFLLNRSTDVEMVKRAIAPMDLDTWIWGGMLRVQKRKVIPQVRVSSYANLLVACDRFPSDSAPLARDHVMGIGLSSLMLAESTIRSKVASALDLGAGAGIQSLLAARHCDNVCSVDLNPRALEFARFNAQLNGFDGIELFEGDFFEPVADRRFDLIVSNPPYVISPQFETYYSDNPHTGDSLCEQIVRRVPDHLNEGGVFQMHFDWAHTKGHPWQDRLAQWCKDSSCDAWVMCKQTRTPAKYAMIWNRGSSERAAFSEAQDRWMASYDELGIEAISSGLITLRRRSGVQNWFRADQGPDVAIAPIGEDIRKLLDTADWLHSERSTEGLMQARLRIADNVCMDQQLQPTPDGWQVDAAWLRRTSGLGYRDELTPDAAVLLYQCTGEKRLGDLIQAIAAKRGVSVEEITPSFLDIVQPLLSQGFLTVNHAASETWIAAASGTATGEPIVVTAGTHLS